MEPSRSRIRKSSSHAGSPARGRASTCPIPRRCGRATSRTCAAAPARLEAAEREREAAVLARHTAEARRTEVERRLADAKLESGRLEGDLALAAERLHNAGQGRATAGRRRDQEEARALQAERERAAATAECEAAERDLASVGQELTGRSTLEQEGRDRLLAQRAAVRDALAELERERVGLAPAAQALLKARARFGDAVIGPLSDFLRTSRRDAVLAEQLLGEWLHAVLVRDANAVETIRRWHEEVQPGPLVLLPSVPGPRLAADGNPLNDDLRVDGPAAAWVRALLAGNEVLDGGEAGRTRGRALRRANGAVFLAGTTAGGPLERRAELEGLEQAVRETQVNGGDAATPLDRTLAELAAAEAACAAAGEAAERARQQELEAGAVKDAAERAAAHAQREATDATAQVERLSTRFAEVETRLAALHADVERHEVERVRLDERLGGERARLVDLEAQQEAAREQRVRWQVDAAQVEARLGAARERAGRAAAEAEEARRQSTALGDEMSALEHETATLTAQRTQWEDQLKERRLALVALEAAAGEAGAEVEAADARVAETETALEDVRKALDARGAEEHKLELERTEIVGRRRGLVARVEAEWRKPLDQLLAEAPVVAGDLEWLRQEDERLRAAIDAVGPVNALAVDEHGEEVKRLEFLMTQRNDLVAARQSLQQAAREIDQTAKAMFLDSFGKVRDNFRTVFQTLFGGGECDVRLANEDEPLESEIEIHAAPRGKRTQRIHLLSSGARTLVAQA